MLENDIISSIELLEFVTTGADTFIVTPRVKIKSLCKGELMSYGILLVSM